MKRIGYMTVCFKDDMEVTYSFDEKNPETVPEVMYETAVNNGLRLW